MGFSMKIYGCLSLRNKDDYVSRFFFKLCRTTSSPVEFRSLNQSVCVSIPDEHPAVQTAEAFWVILLLPSDLLERKHDHA